mgnify:CR=1 FL=1|tara:strand:+ start:204 stop:677 length:474 start_codon:yes stop_codon:yes gene_type:complete
MAKEDFTFFWGGAFSQWYPSPMKIDDVEYNCTEQYMMQQKAKLFGDTEMEAKIMGTNEPRKQKQFGRQVEGFDKDTWEEVAFDVVKKANIAKFRQNQKLLELLEFSKGTEIVEASAYDKIWGIGLAEHDKRAWNKETWQGTNWLGEVLMEVRKELLG